MKNLIYIIFALILFSCNESNQARIDRLSKVWTGKTVYYPVDTVFESYSLDSVRKYSLKRTDYTVVSYIDSTACSTANLKLEAWKDFLHCLKPYGNGKATCLFFFHPEDKVQIVDLLKMSRFNYPVCIDEDDVFNKLNHFPSDSIFKTFILDRNNKILAMGNPVDDPKIKELYLNIIAGKQLLK